jgi:hypothetical protein
MRGTGVDGGDAAGMAGAPDLHQVQRFAAAHFADDHAVGAQAHRGAHQLGHGHDAFARVRSGTWSRAAHCSSMVSSSTSTRSPVAAISASKRIGERGLAAARRPGDQDVLALAHGAAQELGLRGGQDAVGHVAIQPDDAHGALAQREGWPRRGRRQDALEPLAGFGQLGGQQRPPAMHLRADVRGDQADDAFAIVFGQLHAQRHAARRQPIHP